MTEHLNWPATIVFVFFFLIVTILGFYAARWKSGPLDALHEWGLGGRRFGSWISWFLIGGDLYTAYTVVAVPALVYGIGAFGFFAIPYTILIYPFLFAVFPRLWAVCQKRQYITAGDFVAGRYGDRWLALAVCVTGILATMPYIALQLVGMEKVIQALGFHGQGLMSHLPLTIAFIILALYTYSSGLRAPAMIAFVKDAMIYIFVIVAVIYIPTKLGGFGAIFDAAGKAYAAKGGAAGLTLKSAQVMPYITLALGSAMALFLYPHSMTGILAASRGDVIRRNAIALPAYSVVLGLIALMGMMAIAAGIHTKDAQAAVPLLFLKMFPGWFAGFSFAAIAIGALVPAAVMSIGAANTFTRNFWKPFIEPDIAPAKEASLAKLVSLIVKLGALLVILFIPVQFALDLQLLGGVWMVQIFPALIFGLYTRWFQAPALLVGWAVGMLVGTWLSYAPATATAAAHWAPLHSVFGWLTAYNGLTAFVANIIVAVVLSAVWRGRGVDETAPSDYEDARVAA